MYVFYNPGLYRFLKKKIRKTPITLHVSQMFCTSVEVNMAIVIHLEVGTCCLPKIVTMMIKLKTS